MNPLTNVKNITKLNEREIKLGINQKSSWHNQYKDSAWIFVGGLPFALTEGDIICVFSQYGEIVNINLVRDKKTGNSRGFCFLCYENQKSTVLSVDNLNGIKVCGRIIRVDHVENYKPPKDHESDDDILKFLRKEGCAPRMSPEKLTPDPLAEKFKKKHKKEKKKRSKHKKNKSSSDSSGSDSSESEDEDERRRKKKHVKDSSSNQTSNVNQKRTLVNIKSERHDLGYDKHEGASKRHRSPKRDEHRHRHH